MTKGENMKRILILLVAAASFAGCRAGAKVASDGAFGLGAGWENGPKVSGKIPSIDVGAEAGAVPGAVPFAGGATSAPEASAPSPDPEMLARLDKIEEAIKAAETAGSKTPDEIAALRKELESLRAEEKAAPPEAPPKTIIQTITEKAPGFLARLLSGDVMGAIMGPEGLIGTIIALFLAKKGAGAALAARKKRKERAAAIEKALAAQPKA